MNLKPYLLALVCAALLSSGPIFNSFEFVSSRPSETKTVDLLLDKTDDEVPHDENSFGDLASRYELLQPTPEKKPEPEKVAQEIVQAPVIDKSLLPNFQRFDEDHQIGLVGIFDADTTFIVVELLNYESRESEYKKLQVDDALYAYQLFSISNKNVVFKKNENTIELTLFK